MVKRLKMPKADNIMVVITNRAWVRARLCKFNQPVQFDYSIQGRIRRAPPPPKIGKNMICLRKIVIIHTKYPNNFRASLRSRKTYDFLA